MDATARVLAGGQFDEGYGLVGNITTLHVETADADVKEEKIMNYDPLYRLTSATGTEKGIWQDSIPWQEWDTTAPNTVIRDYTEYYTYDKVGFMLTKRHADNGGSYQRLQTYTPTDGNRLGSVTVSGNTFDYHYDALGNLTQSHGNRYYDWDSMGRLQRFTNLAPGQFGRGGTLYLYDYNGNRVKKISADGDVTIYCGSLEIRYKCQLSGSTSIVAIDSTTVSKHHIVNGQALLTLQDGDHPDEWNESYYTFTDHLGTGTITMDTTGNILSIDLYTPFGDTSYTSRPRARHRYCGKEKDKESGLYYYGARYYECWTCRFVSVDPLAEKFAQLSSYNYADNSPVTDLDLDALQGTDTIPGPPTNSTKDNTGVKDATKVNVVAKTPVHGALKAPKNRAVTEPMSTGMEVNNLVPKTGKTNTPEALKRLESAMFPKYEHPILKQGYTREEVRAEAIRKTAWAWGPFAAIGGGLLAAPLSSVGSVGSGAATTMAIKGSVNVASQALEKKGKLGEIDMLDVAVAMAPGVKGLSPRQATLLLNSVSAVLDVQANGKVKSLGNGKSMSEVALDAGGGLVGNTVGSSVAKGPVAQGLNEPTVEAISAESMTNLIKAIAR